MTRPRLTAALAVCLAAAARLRHRLGRARTPAQAASRSRRGTAGCSSRRTSACSRGRTAPPGRNRNRSWTLSASPTARSSPTSAPAPAGSRCAWHAASARRASSTPRTCNARCSTPSGGGSAAKGCATCRMRLGAGSEPNLPARALDAVLVVDVYPEVDRSRDVPAQPRRCAQAERPYRRRQLQAGTRRPRASTGRRRARRRCATVEADARAAGLRVLARENLPYQYLLVLGTLRQRAARLRTIPPMQAATTSDTLVRRADVDRSRVARTASTAVPSGWRRCCS